KRMASAALLSKLQLVEQKLWTVEKNGEAFLRLMVDAQTLIERLNFVHASPPPHRKIDWNERIPKTAASSREGLELHGLTRAQALEKLRSWWPDGPLREIRQELDEKDRLLERDSKAGKNFMVNLSRSTEGGTGKTTLAELLGVVLGWDVVKLPDVSLS